MPAGNNSRRKKWGRRALDLLLFVVLIFGIRAWQQRDMPGGMAPPLSGTRLDGSVYSLPVKPAQPVLVHFWATWCSICRVDQGSIADIAQAYPNTITVAMQSGSAPDIQHFLDQHKVHYPVVNDADGSISAAWGVHAVPASFIIGTDGKIHFVEVGYTTEPGLRLRLWLARILG